MNGVAGVDQASSLLSRDSQAEPKHDFARELAKEHAQTAVSKLRDATEARTRQADQMERAGEGRPDETPDNDEPLAAVPADIDESPSLIGEAIRESVLAPVSPIGITEAFLGARVYGLHLSAQAYLSVLSPSEREDRPGFAKAWPCASADQLNTNADNTCPESLKTSPTLTDWSDLPSNVVGLPMGAPPTAESSAPPIEPLLDVAAGTTAIVWPERVVRAARDANKGLSLWLRDYRISGEEGLQLVGSLLAQARARGESLNRIMLNGREVWTSRGIDTQGTDYAG